MFGAGAVEGVLQRVELRKPIIAQHYYLAIEPCGLGREERDLARKGLHFRGPVVTVAGE